MPAPEFIQSLPYFSNTADRLEDVDIPIDSAEQAAHNAIYSSSFCVVDLEIFKYESWSTHLKGTTLNASLAENIG